MYFYHCSFKSVGHPVIIAIINVYSSGSGFSLLFFDQFIFYQGTLLTILPQHHLITSILCLQKRSLKYFTEEDPSMYSDVRASLCNRYKAKVKNGISTNHESWAVWGAVSMSQTRIHQCIILAFQPPRLGPIALYCSLHYNQNPS